MATAHGASMRAATKPATSGTLLEPGTSLAAPDTRGVTNTRRNTSAGSSKRSPRNYGGSRGSDASTGQPPRIPWDVHARAHRTPRRTDAAKPSPLRDHVLRSKGPHVFEDGRTARLP